MVYYNKNNVVMRNADMEILQLRYFCDAAQSENFTTTAKKFDVPTSAVSQSVHRLENELAAPLFSRQANSIQLNDVGKRFALKIAPALALLDDAVTEASGSAKKRVFSLCIDARRRRMLNIIEKFKAAHPDIDVNVQHGYKPAHDPYDVIITDCDLGLPGYERRLIVSEKLAIAVHKSNPLAANKKLTVDMLAGEPFIAMNEERPMHAVVMKVCADFGFVPHIALQSDDPDYVGRLVSLGMGVAIIPMHYSFDDFAENVLLFPISGYTRDTYAYILQAKHYLPHIRDFWNLLQNA